MAMIKCSECNTEVSDKAAQCPKCACPISNNVPEKVKVIELTSKKLKKQYLIAVFIFLVGLVVWFAKINVTWGVILTFLGIVVIAVTKMQIWWNHK